MHSFDLFTKPPIVFVYQTRCNAVVGTPFDCYLTLIDPISMSKGGLA